MGSENLGIESLLEGPVGFFRNPVLRRQDPGPGLGKGAQGVGGLSSTVQEGQQKHF